MFPSGRQGFNLSLQLRLFVLFLLLLLGSRQRLIAL